MAFLKIAHSVAYFTGAMRTNLDLPALVRKLKRAGLAAEIVKGEVVIRCGEDDWRFENWQPSGLGRIGWMAFSVAGDIGTLSRRLAAADIRHAFEHSRPQDIEVLTTRCITRYEHRWNDSIGGTGGGEPHIETFDELVPQVT